MSAAKQQIRQIISEKQFKQRHRSLKRAEILPVILAHRRRVDFLQFLWLKSLPC